MKDSRSEEVWVWKDGNGLRHNSIVREEEDLRTEKQEEESAVITGEYIKTKGILREKF